MNKIIETIPNEKGYTDDDLLINGLRLKFISIKKHPIYGQTHYFKIEDETLKPDNLLFYLENECKIVYGPIWKTDNDSDHMIRVSNVKDIKLSKNCYYFCDVRLIRTFVRGVNGKAYYANITSATPCPNVNIYDPFMD